MGAAGGGEVVEPWHTDTNPGVGTLKPKRCKRFRPSPTALVRRETLPD
jgi:hypothetical protein